MIPWTPHVEPREHRTITVNERQAAVLDGLCDGLTYPQIGARCGVIADTAKKNAHRMFAAAGAHDRAHLVGLVLTGRVTVLVRAADDPAGDPAYIDDVAVERACKGDRTVTLTAAEAHAAWRQLEADGMSASRIAARLGVTPRQVTRWRSGTARPAARVAGRAA